jgi:predicted aspartyl protease
MQPVRPLSSVSNKSTPAMSLFHVAFVAVNPREAARSTPPVKALVDTGAELSWIPGDLLASAGISPVRQRSFRTASGQVVNRSVGYAILRAEGFETNDEVVFAEPGDISILGVRTLEGFGVTVDPVSHRLLPSITIVAAA